MPTQNEIIAETEAVFEEIRKKVEAHREKYLSNKSVFYEMWNGYNIYLFDHIVLLYTHRTIWDQKNFWIEYCGGESPDNFYEMAYDRFIKYILWTCISDLYFHTEFTLKKLDKLINPKTHNEHKYLLDYYKYTSGKYHNFQITENGLKILRFIRNSGHNGFIFNDKMGSISVNYYENNYDFKLDHPVNISYKYLRQVIPDIFNLFEYLEKL